MTKFFLKTASFFISKNQDKLHKMSLKTTQNENLSRPQELAINLFIYI